MGFLRKLFGGGDKKDKDYVDTRGVYFYVRCDNCGTMTRLRADKEYDLIREGNGFVWHKTIIDSRCFRPMTTVVNLDSGYQVTSSELNGGVYVTKEDFDRWEEGRRVGQTTELADEEE